MCTLLIICITSPSVNQATNKQKLQQLIYCFSSKQKRSREGALVCVQPQRQGGRTSTLMLLQHSFEAQSKHCPFVSVDGCSTSKTESFRLSHFVIVLLNMGLQVWMVLENEFGEVKRAKRTLVT